LRTADSFRNGDFVETIRRGAQRAVSAALQRLLGRLRRSRGAAVSADEPFSEGRMAEKEIPIGALSRRTGCNIETIRYYERIGVLPHPRRNGRYRCYRPDEIGRLIFVRRARELGFTLDEVRALLGLAAAHGDSVCAECATSRRLT
jgi:hypothetical protein